MEYNNKRPRQIGLIITGIGIGLYGLILLISFVPQFQNKRIFHQINESLKSSPLNKTGYSIFIILFLISMSWVIFEIFTPGYQATFKQYERSYTQGDFKAAQRGFKEVIEKWKDQPTIDKVYYFLGLSHFRDKQCHEASNVFTQILPFTDSEFLARAYFHIGLCAQSNNNKEKAKQNYQYIIETLKDPIWSNHAKARLSEIAQ